MADDERREHNSLELPSLRSLLRSRRPERDEEPAAPDERSGPAESARDDSAPAPPLTKPGADASRHRRRVRLRLPGPFAALLTGAVVGLTLVGLTAGSLHVCTQLRGTPSCGKPGILILLAVTAVVILLGSLLLRVTGVAAHGSTSFLGVGLLDALILLAFLPVLDESWVVVAVPVLAMLTFVVSWWLTTTYVEPGTGPR